MSIAFSSPFAIWCDWLNKMQAEMLAQVNSAAIRHSTMCGSASSSNLFWFRTGQQGAESGCFVSMTHGNEFHSASNVSELVNFLKELPADVRQEIVEALQAASGNIL